MFWSVLKRGWTWKGLQGVCFFPKSEGWTLRMCSGRQRGDTRVTWHRTNRRVRANQHVCISSVLLTHVVVVTRLQSRSLDCPRANLLGKWWKRRDLKVKSQARIAQARSLIMQKRCQNWRIGIAESIWQQMGAATCRPSLQHLTEWLMGATEVWLSPNAKHKQQECPLSLSVCRSLHLSVCLSAFWVLTSPGFDNVQTGREQPRRLVLICKKYKTWFHWTLLRCIYFAPIGGRWRRNARQEKAGALVEAWYAEAGEAERNSSKRRSEGWVESDRCIIRG